MVPAQAMTTELSHICVSQQYRWHMMIEAEWEDMRWTNSPRDIFIPCAHYFQLNLDETCFLCNEGELRIIGNNIRRIGRKPITYDNVFHVNKILLLS